MKKSEREALKKEGVIQSLKLGLDFEQAAHIAGMDPRTLRKWRERSRSFALKCQAARAIAIQAVVMKLLEQIKAGSTAATIYFLKSRGGPDWRERKEVTMEGATVSVGGGTAASELPDVTIVIEDYKPEPAVG